MKKHHSSPRTLRRAAERKARKEAFRARKAETAEPQTSSTPDANTGSGPKEKVSQARLDANRANAQHSTGPRTNPGRIASSQNRRIHGLTPGCNFLILETKDAGAFEKLHENLLDEHKPETQSETTAIEDMAQHIWLRQRGRNFQNEALDEKSGKVIDEKKFFLYERYIESHDKAYQRCFLTLSRIRKERELLRLGLERIQFEKMKYETRERVQRLVEEVQKTEDYDVFNDKMFALRDEICKKYRPDHVEG